MTLSEEKLDAILQTQLDQAERQGGVVYVLTEPVKKGSKLDFPQAQFEAPWDATLAFVDREPTANWGHPARYILINRDLGDTQSFEARFPPFQQREVGRWRVFHRPPGLPDRFLAMPE